MTDFTPQNYKKIKSLVVQKLGQPLAEFLSSTGSSLDESNIDIFLSEQQPIVDSILAEYEDVTESFQALNTLSNNSTASSETVTKQLSSSFMSSYNSKSVNDLANDLKNSETSEEVLEIFDKFCQLAKSDTSADFFNEKIINELSSYLDHEDEVVNTKVLIFHATILLNSGSYLFVFQTFQNLITHMKAIPEVHLSSVGAFRRLRLVFDFLRIGFKTNLI